MSHKADTDPPPTPKISCTLQRGPIYAKIALDLAERLEATAQIKARTLSELDIEGSKKAYDAARRARELRNTFVLWQWVDPGIEGRLQDVMRLKDLEAETRDILA